MGLLKFRLPADPGPETELKRAYVVGLDRSPTRGTVEIRQGILSVNRQEPESGRLVIPFTTRRLGRLVLSTATLAERAQPYDLALELARGTVNDLLNQNAEWEALGLQRTGPLNEHLKASRHFLSKAVTANLAADVETFANLAIENAIEGGRILAGLYAQEVTQRRRELKSLSGTSLALEVPETILSSPLPSTITKGFTGGRVHCQWGTVVPDSGRFNWNVLDAQMDWCAERNLTPSIGPLIDLRPHALPDWLWLWQGDFDAIVDQATELTQATLERYRGKISTWQLVHRVCSSKILGLSEEEQIRLTARLVQVARQIEPRAHLIVGFDRPWGDRLATGNTTLGPLHLADALAHADLGLSGIALEFAPGYQAPGSPLRELLEFSRLLDLYSLIGLPLHISLAIPSSTEPDTTVAGLASADPTAWPEPVDESLQWSWAKNWLELAVAKPFVKSVTWLEASDANPRLYTHSGLVRPDGSPKPLSTWVEGFGLRLRAGP